MWIYQKKHEFPVNITTPDLRMAKALLAQYGGPDSELAAGCRYLTQRFSMPDNRVRATCNDIGTEEMAHWEMIGTMIYQCLRGASLAEIEAAGLIGYYTMHDHGVYPADPNGVPFTATIFPVGICPASVGVKFFAAIFMTWSSIVPPASPLKLK